MDNFQGELILFGTDEFPDWDAVIEYLFKKMELIFQSDLHTIFHFFFPKFQEYYKDEIYKNTCFKLFEYVIEHCISDKISSYYEYLTHPIK